MQPDPLDYDQIAEVYLNVRSALKAQARRYVRCEDVAADIVQEIFLRLDRLAGRLPNAEEARRFMLRMATNMALDHYRVETNRARLLESIGKLHDDAPHSPMNSAHVQASLRLVRRAIEAMPERRRFMFLRCRLAGLTYPEIAAELGLSVSLVEKELAMAFRSITETVGTIADAAITKPRSQGAIAANSQQSASARRQRSGTPAQ